MNDKITRPIHIINIPVAVQKIFFWNVNCSIKMDCYPDHVGVNIPETHSTRNKHSKKRMTFWIFRRILVILCILAIVLICSFFVGETSAGQSQKIFEDGHHSIKKNLGFVSERMLPDSIFFGPENLYVIRIGYV
jgi:hypothetical protein